MKGYLIPLVSEEEMKRVEESVQNGEIQKAVGNYLERLTNGKLRLVPANEVQSDLIPERRCLHCGNLI